MTNRTTGGVNLMIDGSKDGQGPGLGLARLGWPALTAGWKERAVRGRCPHVGAVSGFGVVGDTLVAESGTAAGRYAW